MPASDRQTAEPKITVARGIIVIPGFEGRQNRVALYKRIAFDEHGNKKRNGNLDEFPGGQLTEEELRQNLVDKAMIREVKEETHTDVERVLPKQYDYVTEPYRFQDDGSINATSFSIVRIVGGELGLSTEHSAFEVVDLDQVLDHDLTKHSHDAFLALRGIIKPLILE